MTKITISIPISLEISETAWGRLSPDLRAKSKGEISAKLHQLGVCFEDVVFLRAKESELKAKNLPFSDVPDEAIYRGLTYRSKNLEKTPIFYLP